jgi:hypothetical protein
MHDHGLAQHIVEGVGGDADEIGQFGMREFQMRIARARFGEQPVGRIKPLREKSVRVEPGNLAPAAAADIGGQATLEEEARHDGLQIGGRRLLVPVFRKRRRVVVIRGKRRPIHRSAFDPGKIRHRARGAADFVEQL